MPTVSEEKKKEYLALIRRLLVMNPNITVLGIQSALENSKNSFNRFFYKNML